MKSSVTVSLVSEARGGPFVFWDDLPAACRKAGQLGFDAVEIFPPGPEALDEATIRSLLVDNNLKLAAVGTGAGWVKHRLHLTLPDASARRKARDFIRSIIDVAGPLGAPSIIGSMQGRSGDGVDPDSARGYLREALVELGDHARQYGVPLIYEPLNRYETNLVNTIAAGIALLKGDPPPYPPPQGGRDFSEPSPLVGEGRVGGETESVSYRSHQSSNVLLLADLFHMNIEESNIADAIRLGGASIGHVHFVDSNRRPAGLGHIDFAPIVEALRAIGYEGYLSAEAFPFPDPDAAANRTIDVYRRLVG